MDPNKTPPPFNPSGYPPQTPQPGGQSYPQPAPSPQYQQQPQQQPAYQQPQQPPQQPQGNANWYTPAPKPDADRPGDVDSYLRAAAGPGPNPLGQQQQGTVPGQMVGNQYSVDYLNQLAPQQKQPIEKKFIFGGIGAAIALIIAAFLVFSTPKTTSVANEVKLYTTMVSMADNTKQSKRLIKNSQLSAINGNIQTLLVNATRDLETPLENMGQSPSSLKNEAKNGQYADEKLASTLEDARLNGVYDRVYANEVDIKMQYILIYMESIKKNNSRKSVQEFISKNQPSFETIQDSIDEFQNPDASNSN